MKARMVYCLLVGVGVAVALAWLRGHVWQHAMLVGLAVAALVYSILRATDNLRMAARQPAPWDEEEAGDE